MERPGRSRRSVHAIPGTNARFLAKVPALAADEVFLDLEDGAAADQKERARGQVVDALRTLDFGSKTVAVRVNGTETPHYYRDLIAVVEQAGATLDVVIVPKVRTPGDVEMTDKLLSQLELASGLEAGRIGIEAQIEDARGLQACDAIASASPRMEGAGLRSRRLQRRGRDSGHDDRRRARRLPRRPSQLRLLAPVIAARAAGIQAIDGPYALIDDTDGLVRRSRVARALGVDGKWTIHPSQIAVVNEIFAPTLEEFAHASALLAAYAKAAAGAASFGGEMIDEASRKMAERIMIAGRAAGHEGHDLRA